MKLRSPYGVMPDEFQELADDSQSVTLDTRDSQLFRSGFVPGSINIGAQGSLRSLASILLPSGASRLLLITDPGQEEETVLMLGESALFRDIFYLSGGFSTWIRNGKPVESIQQISAESLVQKLAAHQISLIDVRKPSEFYYEHVKGAVNVPLERINKINFSSGWNEPQYVYCAGGYRSVIFNSILRKRGISSLVDVTGGYAAIRNTYRAPLVFASN